MGTRTSRRGDRSKSERGCGDYAGVDGQNSWELERVKIAIFEGYLEKSDKIDGNWVWWSELAQKLKMTK